MKSPVSWKEGIKLHIISAFPIPNIRQNPTDGTHVISYVLFPYSFNHYINLGELRAAQQT